MDASVLLKAVQVRWSGAFERGAWDDLAAMYSQDAQFFGGKPDLYFGVQEIRRYFGAVAPGAKALFQEGESAVRLAEDMVLYSGYVDFQRESRVRMHRLSWLLAKVDGHWKIRAHHASPVPQP
jgi:ketosteroid isomerase-like protein